MKRYISIDIGGTAIKYGIISGDGQILSRSTMKTEAQRGGPAILDTVLGLAGQLSSKEKISGICISTAGMVDVEKGAITYAAPLIPDYVGTEYKKAMEERFRIPLCLRWERGLAAVLSLTGKFFGDFPVAPARWVI